METKAVPKSPSSCKGWARDMGVTAGPALGHGQEITPCALPRDSARPPTLPPKLQMGAEAAASLSPRAPAALGLEERLPHSSRTARTQDPPASRKWHRLPQQPSRLDTLPETCSSRMPVCFRASHLQAQAPGSEIPPSRAGHPQGWAVRGAGRRQLPCSQLPGADVHPPSTQPIPAARGWGPSRSQSFLGGWM